MPIVKSPNTLARCLSMLFILLAVLFAATAAPASKAARASANTEAVAAPASADLRFEPTIEADPPPPQNVFTIGIVNRGPDVAQNAVFRFPIPEGALYNRIISDSRITATLPPNFGIGRGEIICLLGDLPNNRAVTIFIIVDYIVPPGTKIKAQGSLSSDTPDPNPDSNLFSREFSIAPLPRIISVRTLSNPFRIEIAGENLSVPKFGRSGIGIGCDCRDLPEELVHQEGENVILSGGSELKGLFPKGIPVQICYGDDVSGTTIKTIFRRGSR